MALYKLKFRKLVLSLIATWIEALQAKATKLQKKKDEQVKLLQERDNKLAELKKNYHGDTKKLGDETKDVIERSRQAFCELNTQLADEEAKRHNSIGNYFV